LNGNYAINKKDIENYLKDNISRYIDTLTKSFEGDNHYRSSNIEYDSIKVLLNNIRSILYTDSFDQIRNRLIFQEPKIDIKDIITDLDLNEIPEFEKEDDNERIVIEYAIRLIVSRLQLQVNMLISTIQENENNGRYDVFLSHCSRDAKEVLGLKLFLEYKYKLKVYVDWIEDKKTNYPRAIKKVIGIRLPRSK